MEATKDGRPFSSHHSTLMVEIPTKKTIVMITVPQKVHYHSHWKRNQDAVYWIKLSIALDQGLQFWQTKSHAIIVHSLVPADCINEVISRNRDRILFEDSQPPRPAPKVTLESNWYSHQQQQQSICDDVTCTRRLLREIQSGTRGVRGSTTDDQTGTRRLVRDLELAVEKKPHFEIDLRVEGVSQDAILQDEEKMKEINKKLEKLKIGSGMKSIRNDLSTGNMIFSEESSRAICEMGNMELIDLRQTSATTQCPSCFKHVAEGLNMCQCGVWLRPNQSTLERIRTAFAALKTPFYGASTVISRVKNSGHNPWQQDHHKAMDAKRGALKRCKHTSLMDRWQNDEVYRESHLNWHTVGLTSGSSTSTTTPRLTSFIMHLTDSDYDMIAPST